MKDNELHRRRFLALAGAAAVTGLAGCSTAQSSEDPTTTTTEESHEDDEHDEAETTHGEEGHHEDDDHGHGGDLSGPAPSATVDMVSRSDGEHFAPHVVWVEAGGTVTFHNESGAHSATAYAPANDKPQLIPEGAASFDSGLLSEQGASFEHTFETPGVYHYYCIPHETMGMIGSVIVGEPDAHGQPALEEPPESMPEPVREKLHSLNEQCNAALGHEH